MDLILQCILLWCLIGTHFLFFNTCEVFKFLSYLMTELLSHLLITWLLLLDKLCISCIDLRHATLKWSLSTTIPAVPQVIISFLQSSFNHLHLFTLSCICSFNLRWSLIAIRLLISIISLLNIWIEMLSLLDRELQLQIS